MPPPEPRESELPRARLLRVLALDEDASPGEIQRRGLQLLRSLRARRESLDAADSSAPALEREIETLETALARHARAARGTGRRRAPAPAMDRTTAIAIALGALCAVALFFLLSDARHSEDGSVSIGRALRLMPARLVLTGPLPEATLRVFDADRRRVLHERPAQDASLELRPGRYALEVSRPGCGEPWTQSFYFESGATRTFAPSLCSGEGGLRIRTNVEGPTITIDGASVEMPRGGVVTLPVGEHLVRVAKPGHRDHEATVRIKADRTHELAAELAPSRPGGDPRAEARALLESTRALAPPRLTAPEPFDLSDLRDQVAPPAARERASRLLERAGLGGLPDGGSTAWHDRVSSEFLRRFDSDGSGRIDRIEESDGVSCDYWLETEASFELGGLGLSMARYYGFDGTEWHPGALGFDRRLRGAAYERMRECGLQR